MNKDESLIRTMGKVFVGAFVSLVAIAFLSPQYLQFKLLERWNGIMPLSLGSSSILSIATPPQGG